MHINNGILTKTAKKILSGFKQNCVWKQALSYILGMVQGSLSSGLARIPDSKDWRKLYGEGADPTRFDKGFVLLKTKAKR